MEVKDNIQIMVADERHVPLVETILDTIEKAAKIRGTGIARRSPEYVKQKMLTINRESYVLLIKPSVH